MHSSEQGVTHETSPIVVFVIDNSTGTDKDTTRLVAILHDFEQFEPSVIQDFFEICRSADSFAPIHRT